ncbi:MULTISPECIES: 3-hydroxyacyl-CoA dehydrogenase NAD-binding domain-containing protein [unclassified Amycolatopsis]|uniref:3-hydroxyacyl-CoA dehydrogenase family protein n=1 Tax=unclassified Amycolatopsis TaxID=2618356 RepID=UPI0028758757|nr:MULTISPECIES: 3-hydroxyacyl-CoA dehydrogenase NAD-binding domain-containing protein [unclassified Amycolatopsis]MDS0134248.1 NAD-binding protein [Amycolatopsis sp. 505]MDS0146811.1 NAD-binding protein [Amycolatopsis sp. CM201R]
MAVTGVVGAGVMGIGVAQDFAAAGHEVVLVDKDERILEEARAAITRNCRLSRLMGGPALDADEILARITTAVGLAALDKTEILVENVTEDWDIKAAVHAELDEVCGPGTVIIANTSAVPITRIASVGKNPGRVIGVHFMNPVPQKPVVELIPGFHTSPETILRTRELLTSIGKRWVDVKDASGFVSNRVLMLTVNEAAYLVHEGVATAESVDEVFRGCFGHPMGPLETADLIGVDTILYSVEVLYEHYADSKYRPCPLLKQMTDAGLHGRKSGRGFYTYS